MFGLFKKDPVEKLRKEHADLMARAHKMSTVDRAKSDALVAQAAQVEAKLVALQAGRHEDGGNCRGQPWHWRGPP
ncbi:MAG: Lacal_2735 family protein [Flavobacteriales bacterium]|nr:Lacal_2735 family protein [Flavobacteriales bacterium]